MVTIKPPTESASAFQWEELLDLLRNEMQEYGGLVGLLKDQQDKILSRDPEALIQVNQSVGKQMEASQRLLAKRQGFVSNLACKFGQDKEAPLSDLLSFFPAVTRPMFESIVDEINTLITSVRGKLDQNRRLLSRLTEVTDGILTALSPQMRTKTYDRVGGLSVAADVRGSTLSESA
jgi:hypothetical protein